jgi:hypothetical protein
MQPLERESNFPSGEWSGYFIENRPEKGWMHLYLSFRDGQIKGEGTDYVGPWHIRGEYEEDSGKCQWIKQYLGRHQVCYGGTLGDQGIVGTWKIGDFLQGKFHIWPKGLGGLDEMYLQQELNGSGAF